jgi:AraC family transcriptional regulator, regulatory protein of adaptative response / DNA-3-methyladenine glycosylase II
MAGRMASNFGRPFRATNGLTHFFPTPEALADATLANIGLTGARAETIRSLARAVCSGKINFEEVVDAGTFLNRLCEIPGIGNWTAQYVAMRALGEPNAFPSSDLRLQRTMALGTSRALEQRAEGWKPWRAYAAMYLWTIASQSALDEKRPESFANQKIADQGLTPRHSIAMSM